MASPVGITFDVAQVNRNIGNLVTKVKGNQVKICLDIAEEIMRLSQREVPHDKGMLQNSGVVRPESDGAIVGYNKSYAAYQHEGARMNGSHRILRYQKGRKGKYLEDPIKRNKDVFKNYLREFLK